MPEHSQDVPLLLLCAEDSEVALVQLVDALNRNGRAPELVSGIEDDPSLLSEATDRVRGPALFVLCETRDLDRSQTLQLQGLFSARRGPRHQLLVVEVDERRPLDALSDIEAGLIDAARAKGGGFEAAHVPKREVVHVPAGRSAAADDEETEELEVLPFLEAQRRARAEEEVETSGHDEAGEDAEALARAFHEEMIAAEAVLDRRQGARQDADPNARAPGTGVPEPVGLEPTPKRPTAHTDDEPTPPIAVTDDEELGPLSSSLAGVAVAEPLTSIQTDLTPTDTRPRCIDPEESDTSSPTARLEENASRRGWWLAALGAAALGGVALFVSQGAPQPRTAAGNAAASASTGTPASMRPPSLRPRHRASARTVAAEIVPEPEPEAVEVAPEAFEPEAVEPEPKPKPPIIEPASTPSMSVPPAPVDSEGLRIQEALRSGKVRAIDALLVARPGEDVTDWARARTLCRRKRVAGVGGWRLPTRWQLQRLDRAKMLEEGTYWSRERGPHDDDAYALDTRSGAMNVYLHIEPAAKVQCVRKR